MRRLVFLAITLLFAASVAAFAGQTPVGAQPVAIQVVATSANTFQVTTSFNSDEIPVTFSVTSSYSGSTAAVTSLSLLSCTHYYLGNCTAAVPDQDGSVAAYSTGAGLANVDAGNTQEPVTFVVSVTLDCSGPVGAVIVGNQGGMTLSAPINCGVYYGYPGYNCDPNYNYNPYTPNYSPYNYNYNYGCGYGYGYTGYYIPNCNGTYYTTNYLTTDCKTIYINPSAGPFITGTGTTPGTVYVGTGGRNLGAGLAAINGASGTQRNLAYARQQAAAAAAAQAAAAFAAQQAQQIVPPRTGEAGWVELYPEAQYPMVTYYDEVPEDQIAVLESEEAPGE